MDEELSSASSTIGRSVEREVFFTSGESSRNAIRLTENPLKMASHLTTLLPKSRLRLPKYSRLAKTEPASRQISKNQEGYEVISENPTTSKGFNK